MSVLHVGCSEAEIPVPLFTELYGYGPFLGRRNRGVHDPLHCRVASFGDGDDRLIVVTNDLVTIDPEAAWAVSQLGHLLLNAYNLVFETLSLVLLLAIIGAILIARRERAAQ